MSRLAVILPYDENHIENFTNHFKQMVDETEFYYKLCFLKQKSNRPLNKGKLFNIGFSLLKNQFDYFCFHDIDLIPVSNECDYSHSDKPTSLIRGLMPMEFGDHEEIEDYDNFDVPYDQHFGGCILMDKKHYELVNGHSNDYWGLGYQDIDLLARMITKEIPLRSVIERPMTKTFATFNGTTSRVTVSPKNNKIRKVTDKNFSMSLWFNVKDVPTYGALTDNNRCEYFLFGRPGYHMGLSITHEGLLKGVIWDKDENPYVVQSKRINFDTWNHAALVVNMDSVKLYLNNVLVSKRELDNKLKKYGDKNYYIGVGNPTSSSWKNFCKGSIGEIGIWNYSLSESEISRIFDNGVTDKNGNFTTTNLPTGFWDFNSGYDDIVFDMSGHNNNGIIHHLDMGKKMIKTSTERYLPYRRNGYYAYIGDINNLSKIRNYKESSDTQINNNRNIFNKKINNFEQVVQKDGLNSTRFRIVKRENYQQKHEIIEVVI
tara:strand:- start:28 stop:1488 length:1461 start_codon:yes stop_codon:yes gene_type:complete